MLPFAFAIFMSAFLLFQVQPLIARFILPWFGGSTSVWTTCMLFFQLALLLGYGYAHLLTKKVPAQRQLVLHVGLLVLSLLFLPIIPAEYWKPAGDESPSLAIVILLAATIGGPYILLSATSPLLQAWFSRSFPGVSPFRLFALSNFGSLLALFSYPFLFEPNLRLSNQAYFWSIGYALFAVVCSIVAWLSYSRIKGAADSPETTSQPNNQTADEPETNSRSPMLQTFFWLALSAFPSILLLATTSQICQEVAVTPFLWVLPLGLYLLTFIISFDSPRWYNRTFCGTMMITFTVLACFGIANGVDVSIWLQLLGFNGTLFFCCLMCHGELARIQPHPSQLTKYYLMIALGGAIGGVFTALVAPMIFTTYFELPISIIGCMAISLWAMLRDNEWYLNRWLGLVERVIIVAALVIIIGAGLILPEKDRTEGAFIKIRDFHGTLNVTRFQGGPHGEYLTLTNGRIQHGIQFMSDELRGQPVSYYGRDTGVGLGIALLREQKANLKLGIIGLGAGVMAAYGQPGDDILFYELNPSVLRVAETTFQYLNECQSDFEVKLGDARIVMERDVANAEEKLDLIAVDAFSSDAIPTHLLTRECFETYENRLTEDGVLAIHVSNRFLRLEPVVYSLAEDGGWECRLVDFDQSDAADEEVQSSSSWMLLTKSKTIGAQLSQLGDPDTEDDDLSKFLWTDDFSSLWQVMRPPNWKRDIKDFFAGD